MHIDGYKPADMPTYFSGNNHGGIVEINRQWYIFYHRHTNGTNFSRQGCAERIDIQEDGHIPQAGMTSCGLNNGPLAGQGTYAAYLACHLFLNKDKNDHPSHHEAWMDGRFPKITQDGKDGDEEPGFIANMRDSAVAGFKYFDCKNISTVSIRTRGYARGHFEVKTSWDGEALGKIPVEYTNVWVDKSAEIKIPDGINALFFEFKGHGSAGFASFTLL
jgi:hypothetical protein